MYMDDEWSLTAEQTVFMTAIHSLITGVVTDEIVDLIRILAYSHDYKLGFGEMSFDEAVDRYLCMLDERSG
jgi:hypothetical protein